MAQAPFSVGETIDVAVPKVGRAARLGSHAWPEILTVEALSLIVLAFSMSTDAFAAAVGKGATLYKPPLREALRTGLIFGCVEAITTLIGWAMGLVAAQYIASWDHWLAFVLLSGLGIHMIWSALSSGADTQLKTRNAFGMLVLTAISTSMDSLVVGVTLVLMKVNIVITAVVIGVATTLMVTLGIMLGRYIGQLVGKWAEVVGGVVLILVGASILFEHLGHG